MCFSRKPTEINRILINVSSPSLSHFASIVLCLKFDAVTDKSAKRTRQKGGDTIRTSDILNLMISLPRWVYKKIFRAIISWPTLSSHNISSLKSCELLPHDSHPRFGSNSRIIYVFHWSDKLRSYVFDAKIISSPFTWYCSSTGTIYRIPPLCQSSCFIAGSTFFRSACDVDPIFQRIIRIPLSRDRICHPMRFSFLPDCTGEYRCRVA